MHSQFTIYNAGWYQKLLNYCQSSFHNMKRYFYIKEWHNTIILSNTIFPNDEILPSTSLHISLCSTFNDTARVRHSWLWEDLKFAGMIEEIVTEWIKPCKCQVYLLSITDYMNLEMLGTEVLVVMCEQPLAGIAICMFSRNVDCKIQHKVANQLIGFTLLWAVLFTWLYISMYTESITANTSKLPIIPIKLYT